MSGPPEPGSSVEFLVALEFRLPTDLDSASRAELLDRESAQAKVLADRGLLIRLWRQPGRFANYGLWRVQDATELHDALSSLPLFPYLEATVIPLARHPNDPGNS
jgi:muconolactone D-isomerase